MPDTYQENLGDPSSEPKKFKKKNRRWIKYTIDTLLIVVLGAVAIVSANIIYLSTEFGSSFYVNGASMYPTLNYDALRNEGGTYRKFNWNDGGNRDGDIVDWGWAKMGTKDWKSDLKRYDILITYYKEDYVKDSYGNVTSKLINDPSLKVKRLIAFPGETVKFEYNPDNYAWGKTTVTHVDGTSEVLKELYTIDNYPNIGSKKYPSPEGYGTWTLKENEYFLMGDNRGGWNSKDSRSEGPIPLNFIQGKCHLITARRRLIKQNNSKNFSTQFMLNYLKMPWDYIHLA
ncbi:MAG: signal peptidase I [Bacilli bacterium]|nr:signal peptidase I [Bacilli bacterium]MDY6430406.1 signal peptidase I [Bacilli bacterium]